MVFAVRFVVIGGAALTTWYWSWFVSSVQVIVPDINRDHARKTDQGAFRSANGIGGGLITVARGVERYKRSC